MSALAASYLLLATTVQIRSRAGGEDSNQVSGMPVPQRVFRAPITCPTMGDSAHRQTTKGDRLPYLIRPDIMGRMSLFSWCQWLQHTPLATTISESSWLFPIIEGSHILALPLSVGMIVIFDLRLLGVAFGEGMVSKIVVEFLRWAKIGFAVMFITGLFLFMTQAEKAYGNGFFRTKLILLLLLGINAGVYQFLFYPRMAEWDLMGRAPRGARLCAALSLVAWIGVIVCGRTMAYQF